MSHAEAELYIHPPILDTSVADQRIANALWWNGLHMELPEDVEEVWEESMMIDDDQIVGNYRIVRPTDAVPLYLRGTAASRKAIGRLGILTPI